MDGASKGNPGEAGAGCVVAGPDGETILKAVAYLGRATNNEAEYRALFLGLEILERLNFKGRVLVRTDSALLAGHFGGHFKVSPKFLPFYREALQRLQSFRGWRVEHVPRTENRLADRLANEAVRLKTPFLIVEERMPNGGTFWGQVLGSKPQGTQGQGGLHTVGKTVGKWAETLHRETPTVTGAAHGLVNIAGGAAGGALKSIADLAAQNPSAAGALALGVGGLAYLRRKRALANRGFY
ncbi:MAG: ribonuclease HI family protein [Candidatus Hadarchaeum sp.]